MGKLNKMDETNNHYNLQKEAKRIKKELDKIHIFAESDGIKITVSGSQEIVKVEITDDKILNNTNKIEEVFLYVTNKAMKKSQEVSTEKMKTLMGRLM